MFYSYIFPSHDGTVMVDRFLRTFEKKTSVKPKEQSSTCGSYNSETRK